MVDNTIALRVQTPQLESPLNRMARGLQLQAYKAQADTAQQDLATRNSLRTMMSAPGFDITDPKNAQALMAADPKLGTQMVSGMTAVQDLATKKAETGRKTLSMGMLSLIGDPSDSTVDKVATTLAAAGVPQDALDSTIAAIKAKPLEQRPALIYQFIARNKDAQDALAFTMPKYEKRTDGRTEWMENTSPTSHVPFGDRKSIVELQAGPDAVLAANTAAAKRQLDLDTERSRLISEGVSPEATGLGMPGGMGGGVPAPMAAPANALAPAAPVNAFAAPGGAGAAAPMAAPAAPTAAPAAPARGPTGAPLARDKTEAKRLSELTEKLPVAEVALENATNAIDERIALVKSIMEDASLPVITGGGAGKYKSTVQSFNPFDDGPNLADLQGQIDRLSSEGMFIRMQELRAASPTGSTGLAAQSNAEGQALRESFAQLNQAQSPAKFKQELERILAQLKQTKTGLTKSFAAEFAPIRGGAAPQDGVINFEDLQ
jgi:hypothetical protein